MTIDVAGDYTVNAGQNLTFDGSSTDQGVYSLEALARLTVYGTVLVQGGLILTGVRTDAANATLDIAPGGSFTVSSSGPGNVAGVYGLYADVAPATFDNDGTFVLSAAAWATGVDLVHGGVFSNTGVFTVSGQDGWTTGVFADGPAQATNTGSISVSGPSQVAAIDLVNGARVTNSGTITAASSGGPSYGILVGDQGYGTSTVVNSGTVTAQYAFVSETESGFLTVTNTGLLNGDVILGQSSGSKLYNTGAIHGDVAITYGLYDGRGGTVSGTLTGTGVIYLGDEGETVHGGFGSLEVYSGAGNDALDGGGGVNTVGYLSAASGVTVSLALQGAAQNTVGGGIDTLVNFQNLTGSRFADRLTGDAGDNTIDGGGGGGDVLDGAGGTNTVSFASAVNFVRVSLALQGQPQDTTGRGSDILTHFQNLTGSPFNDTLEGDSGNNTLDGGLGTYNTVSYAHATAAVNVSLALQTQAQDTGGAGIDTLSNFQNVTGSAFDDTLEPLYAFGGFSVLDGGAGTNTVTFAHATAGVNVSLFAGNGGVVNLQGYGSNASLHNMQHVIGSAFADNLEGGGSPSTSLTGALGADTFVYRGGDGDVTITDFSHAQGDVIDLSRLDCFYGLGTVLSRATQVGSDVVIAFPVQIGGPAQGGELLLENVTLGSLTAQDFILSPGPTVGPGIGGTPQTGNGPINGGFGDDWLQGGPGDDILHGDPGSDYLDGGGGLNTALYDTLYREFVIAPGAAVVAGGGGIDVLTNIQRVQFLDGYLATSPTDTAGQVYRLYEATLNRAPDPVGLANWVHALNGGTSLQTVVDGFVGSPEFQADYGALDNRGFVTLLYHNVLHRDPDASGLANWIAALNSGQSRAQVVTGFSESQEDVADLAAPVRQGLWIQDAGAAELARLYDTVLGRLPDDFGLWSWMNSLKSGTSLQTVAANFVASKEFQSTYGALDNPAFLTLLYHNVLHRDPDAPGLDNWLATLASGHSRAEVVLDFSESQEHIANTAAHIDYGVWSA